MILIQKNLNGFNAAVYIFVRASSSICNFDSSIAFMELRNVVRIPCSIIVQFRLTCSETTFKNSECLNF